MTSQTSPANTAAPRPSDRDIVRRRQHDHIFRESLRLRSVCSESEMQVVSTVIRDQKDVALR
jgi:hypothetical protein